jgi:hypothetical protein
MAGAGRMVALKRSDGKEVWVNADLVRLISPTTTGKCTVWFAVDHCYDVFGEARQVASVLNAD